MKIEFKDGSMVAVAENLKDVEVLMALKEGKTKHRKHKKHNFKKVCELCGRSFKGKKGLARHQSKCRRETLTTTTATPTIQLFKKL